MDLQTARQDWQTHGFVVLPGYLGSGDLAAVGAERDLAFPSPGGFHDGSDPRAQRYRGDEFDGIDVFPFASPELSLLAVHPRLIDLAAALLVTDDLRLYSAEAWAKYTGAADYEQDLHRDYLNHTILVPTDRPDLQQLELFVFLVDVPEDLGPPHFVSRTCTAGLPPVPNWFPRAHGSPADRFVAPDDSVDLYRHEVSAAGPAGTVVAFTPDTVHRGTGLTRPGGARYSMQLCYRPAGADWANRMAWADRSHTPEWYRFIERAAPRQLALFGFPPPGHPYWTAHTLAGVALRYPTLDLVPWRAAMV